MDTETENALQDWLDAHEIDLDWDKRLEIVCEFVDGLAEYMGDVHEKFAAFLKKMGGAK